MRVFVGSVRNEGGCIWANGQLFPVREDVDMASLGKERCFAILFLEYTQARSFTSPRQLRVRKVIANPQNHQVLHALDAGT
jgi:hypothetical protein